ncbi:OsmC family protein [Flagellatimonas centrodinii]|uniref:OsmC family protein n=1 Tax=Flagellatimonas centrodinii TaxID=2806210 RepID=UPI001FEF7A20|nr:OsmC family protein [Flagellatimonas centrodinii]ULQ47376.1 OsmC family protein [Flagellatimonas centrodinii]
MKARVKWAENAAFIAESGSGHAIVVDGPEHIGGRNLGPRPMELMLMSVGACSSVDVVFILKKARQPVSDCYVEVEGTRAETEPKVFTAIHLHFVVTGTGLNEAQVKRAVALSAEKYCSASIMLGNGGVTMTHSHEVRVPG